MADERPPDCICLYEERGLGILYGISLGKGMVRMNDDPQCPIHGTDQARREAAEGITGLFWDNLGSGGDA